MNNKPFPFSVCKECCETETKELHAKDISYSGEYWNEEQNVEDAINYLGGEIDAHSGNIAGNFKSIQKNTTDIATNKANIEKNATDIELLKNDLASNEIALLDMEERNRNIFANALKGTASGESIALKDTSPAEHTLGVKVRSENIEDISKVKVYALGKNLLPYPYYDFKDGTGTMEKYGLTITVDDKGAVTLNGTTTGNTQINLCRMVTALPDGIKCGDKITISKNCNDESQQSLVNFTFNYYDADGKQTGGHAAAGKQSTTGTVAESWVGCFIYLYVAKDTTLNNLTLKPQIELGSVATESEPYKEPVEYEVNADGTVNGVKSIYPGTTLTTDAMGAVIDCEYNRDINKAFAEIANAIIALGGNI